MADGENFSSQLLYFSPRVKQNEVKIMDSKNLDEYVLDDYTKEYALKNKDIILKSKVNKKIKVSKNKKIINNNSKNIPKLVGKRVRSNKYGLGIVTSQNNEIFEIKFETGLIKKFAYPIAIDKKTLEIVDDVI